MILSDPRDTSLDTPARLRARTAHHRLSQPRRTLDEEQAIDAAYWVVAAVAFVCVVAVLVAQ